MSAPDEREACPIPPGEAPRHDDRVTMLRLSEPGLIGSVGARSIIFLILAAYGLEIIYSNCLYLFFVVPGNGSTPWVKGLWNVASNALIVLGALAMIGLAIDLLASGRIKRRHSIELALVLTAFGLPRLATSLFWDYRAISISWMIVLNVENLLSYVGPIVGLYLASRLFLKKRISARPTLFALALFYVSVAVLRVSDFAEAFTLRSSFTYPSFLFWSWGLDLIVVCSASYFFVEGCLGRWPDRTKTAPRGLPMSLKVAVFVYGLSALVSVAGALVFNVGGFREFAANYPGLFIYLIVETAFGLSIIGASLYPWNLQSLVGER